MRPRLRRSYRPSTARPCTRGNRETIRAWSLTLPSSSSWTDEKSCQGLFLYNLKNRILETTFVIIFFSFLFILLRFFYDSRYSRIFLFLDITDWSTSLFKLIQIQYILKIFLRLEKERENFREWKGTGYGGRVRWSDFPGTRVRAGRDNSFAGGYAKGAEKCGEISV